MTKPIDIIAETLLAADSPAAAGRLDEVENPEHYRSRAARVVDVLTTEDIVANATRALIDEGWDRTELPDGLRTAALANIARVVLRSVGGA